MTLECRRMCLNAPEILEDLSNVEGLREGDRSEVFAPAY
jgi:hypothetical protein